MPRPSTVLVIFVVSLNLFTIAFGQMGVFAAAGLDNTVHASDQIPKNQTSKVNTGSSNGYTLFGAYNVLTTQVSGVYGSIYPVLDLLTRTGVPGELTYGVMGNLFSFVILFDVISFWRGWGL